MGLGYLGRNLSLTIWDHRGPRVNSVLVVVFVVWRFVSVVRGVGRAIFGLVELGSVLVVYLVVDDGMLRNMGAVVCLGHLVAVVGARLLV